MILVISFFLTCSLLGTGLLILPKNKIDIIQSFALGTFLTVIILSCWSILFPSGFRLISIVLFSFGIIILTLRLRNLNLPRLSLFGPKYSIYLAIIVAFIIKVTYLSLYKPIIDPDVINYYLPFARSLVVSDHLPTQSIFNSLPITNTPIGSLILPAVSYLIAGSTTAEAFRLINLPFIFAFLIITYRFVRRLTGSTVLALQTVAIMVSLPFIDTLLFEALFYPDFIFAFFSLLAFEQMLLLSSSPRRVNKHLILLGIYLSASLLFKFQAVFYLPFVTLWLIFISPLPLSIKKSSALVFSLVFILLRVFHPETLPAPHPLLFLVLPIIVYFVLRPEISLPHHFKPRLSWLVIFLLTLSSGGIWFYRNLVVYKNLLIRLDPNDLWTYIVQGEIAQKLQLFPSPPAFTFQNFFDRLHLNAQDFAQPPLSILAILFWPSLGSLWLIFKLVGFIKARRTNSLPFMWLFYWYLIWVVYLGAVSDRHLLPILPFLAFTIALGINTFFKPSFAALTTFLLSLLSLIQSRFLSWNLGVALIGRSRLKSLAETTFFSPSATTQINTQTISLIEKIKIFLSVLNTPGDAANNHWPTIVLSSIALSLLLMILLPSLAYLLHKTKPKLFPTSLLFLLLPYLITIFLVTNFHPQDFTVIEQNKVYSYAGQFESIIPYLKTANSADKIILLGPSTGLAYYLNRPVIDLLNTSDLALTKPMFSISDARLIRGFLNANRWTYLVISTDDLTAQKIDFLNQKSSFFKYLTASDSSQKVVSPTATSNWFIKKLH